MIAIHNIHRQLAHLTSMNMENGKLVMGIPELRMIMPLLRKNLELVQEIDGYKEAAYAAQVTGNMDLVQHFVAKLEEVEVKCL